MQEEATRYNNLKVQSKTEDGKQKIVSPYSGNATLIYSFDKKEKVWKIETPSGK